MRLQNECNSWRNGIFRATKEKEKLTQEYNALYETHNEFMAEHEQAMKMLKHSDATLKDALVKSKAVADEFAVLKTQHADLVEAATTLVDSIDHRAPDALNKPLIERVREVPRRFAAYLKKTYCFVANHVLAVIQSFYPEAELDDVPTGRAEDCEKDKFEEYLQHFEPIAAEVVEGLQM
ncbi:unnamed protein product [Urochloa humidicola]